MNRRSVTVSVGALLLMALVYFFDENGICAALLLAAAVHEAGHVLALRMLGAQVTGLRIELSGLCLDYRDGPAARARCLPQQWDRRSGRCWQWCARWPGGGGRVNCCCARQGSAWC